MFKIRNSEVIPFLLLIIAWASINSIHATKQTLIVCESNHPCHNTTFETYTDNIRDLSSSSNFTNIRTACSTTPGIWMIYSEADFAPSDLQFLLNTFENHDGENAHSCATLISKTIKSIRHVGSSELSQSAISLYTDDAIIRGSELYFEGSYLELPFEIKINSYGYTGVETWILEHETGNNKTCLDLANYDQARINAKNREIITVKQKVDLKAKFILKGCTGQENQTVAPDKNIKINPDGKMRSLNSDMNSLEHLALNKDMNMNSPGLKLEVLPDGNIDEEPGTLEMIGEKLSLIEPLQLVNYSFIGEGQRNWTFYSGPNFEKNNSTFCLIYNTSNELNDTEIYFGSIQVGCEGDPPAPGMASTLRGATFLTFLAAIIAAILAID